MAWTDRLNVKIFADGAELDSIKSLAANPAIRGFTTNPSLMRKAGVTDYEDYARRIIAAVPDRPISFEVFADDFDDMIAQGRAIAAWGAFGGGVEGAGMALGRLLLGTAAKWVVVAAGLYLAIAAWHLPALPVLAGTAMAALAFLAGVRLFNK